MLVCMSISSEKEWRIHSHDLPFWPISTNWPSRKTWIFIRWFRQHSSAKSLLSSPAFFTRSLSTKYWQEQQSTDWGSKGLWIYRYKHSRTNKNLVSQSIPSDLRQWVHKSREAWYFAHSFPTASGMKMNGKLFQTFYKILLLLKAYDQTVWCSLRVSMTYELPLEARSLQSAFTAD